MLADVADAARHCSYCPKLCRYACPVATETGMESVTPWGIDREITAAVAHGVTPATAAAVYACTGCRACGSVCLPGLDLPTHVRAARAAVVAAGLAPAGLDEEAGRLVAPDAALAAGATPGAPLVLYPGCRSEDGPALVGLFAAARLPYDVVGEASCCGARDADVGHADRAEERAERIAVALGAARTVVVADPHCARWLGIDREDARVVTLTRFLAEEVLPRVRVAAAGSRAVWHDPCWLGRGLGEYDAPRAALAAAGTSVVEPAATRDRARCTGGGMGFAAAYPDVADALRDERADELRAAGGLPVVTACPTAAARLRAAGLDAYDIAGWLASRLDDREAG